MEVTSVLLSSVKVHGAVPYRFIDEMLLIDTSSNFNPFPPAENSMGLLNPIHSLTHSGWQ